MKEVIARLKEHQSTTRPLAAAFVRPATGDKTRVVRGVHRTLRGTVRPYRGTLTQQANGHAGVTVTPHLIHLKG